MEIDKHFIMVFIQKSSFSKFCLNCLVVITLFFQVGSNESTTAYSSIKFNASETTTFINLVKWALRALDLYTLSINSTNIPSSFQSNAQILQQRQTSAVTRNKEEKEVLEHFSGVVRYLIYPQI